MAERGAIWLITIAALIVLASAQFKISDFEYIKSSSSVAYNWMTKPNLLIDVDPFSAAGTDKSIWLVSRRYSPLETFPNISGGFVSTLHLANNTWTHRPHTLDLNNIDFKLLSLHGRLIMLVFASSNGVKYGKLYSWNELEWTEIPFDPRIVENPVDANLGHLAVTVPDQSGAVAYLAASGNDGRTTKAVVSKLEINFDANSQPINATLSLIHRSTYNNEPASILVTPINDGQLYVFWYDLKTIGVKSGEILDLKSNDTRPFEIMPTDTLVQHQILLDNSNDNCFQFRDRLLFVDPAGGHVWSFDLNMHRLQDGTLQYPLEGMLLIFGRNKMVLDQKSGQIYVINFSYGVFKAKIDL